MRIALYERYLQRAFDRQDQRMLLSENDTGLFRALSVPACQG